jgi:hypothetical protein
MFLISAPPSRVSAEAIPKMPNHSRPCLSFLSGAPVRMISEIQKDFKNEEGVAKYSRFA